MAVRDVPQLTIDSALGVIADTHGQLRPEALTLLADCEAIVHLGDVGDSVGDEAILERLAAIAPL